MTKLNDFAIAIGLFVLSVAINLIGLDALQFFRHTEADRSLIAWEMFLSGDYLVPHLIHSPILTKPPLFYWLVAASIWMFGVASEWTTRFPTVMVSGCYIAVQFVFLRVVGASRSQSIVGALALLTGSAYFVLATRAEIDLTFGFTCSLALYAAFLGLQRASVAWLLLGYALAGVAFLVKGPPIVFFLGAAIATFYGYQLLIAKSPQAFRLRNFLLLNIVGALIFVTFAALWLVPIAARFGWSELVGQFHVEVLERVLGEARLSRGPLFYVGAAAMGFLPWTPFVAMGMLSVVRRDETMRAHPLGSSFAVFNFLAFVCGVVMLSLAAGKSSRYLFPVYACGINVALVPLTRLPVMPRSASFLKYLARVAVVLAPLLLVGSPFLKLEGVSTAVVILTAALLAAALAVLALSARRSFYPGLMVGVLLLTAAARFGEAFVYAPHRHSKRSVLPAVAQIDSLLPPGARLYQVELFERWITFYLKHRGRETYRVTPEVAAAPVATEGRVYLLLSEEEETWRFDQLRAADPTATVVAKILAGRTGVLLVTAQPAALASLNPTNHFPTVPSNQAE